jgi:hypothetical protein
MVGSDQPKRFTVTNRRSLTNALSDQRTRKSGKTTGRVAQLGSNVFRFGWPSLVSDFAIAPPMTGSVPTLIKDSLIRLTTSMNSSDSVAMLRAMEDLDALVATHGGQIDPRLHHFLARRSYAKALQFLTGATDSPAGTCAPPERPAS